MNHALSKPESGVLTSPRYLEWHLQHYRYRIVPAAAWMSRASVAALLHHRNDQPELLFIQRSLQQGDPWSGHMAFPGGRMEPQDRDVRATVERETFEELGIQLGEGADLLGRMSDTLATAGGRHLPLVISPWLYRVHERPVFRPNGEVANTVWVPLSFFRDASNRQFFDYEIAGFQLRLPCYVYEGYKIWGLTLRMVDELLDIETRARASAHELYLRHLTEGYAL